MRRIFCLAAVLAAATAATAAVAAAQTGNGAPSGTHYSLNIIGVSRGKNVQPEWASGHVIFVALGGKTGASVSTKILLSQSADGSFDVLDKNGTDGEASFSLPAPGGYTVWARALGTPGGHAKITTCATDITLVDSGVICSTQNEVFVRGTGKSSFRNVTNSLTTITLDPVADAAAVTACGGTSVNLFDPCLEGFFWQYDNNGLKLLQVRFYPNPS
ncbi:MAG TPA: hypothetical protein VGQ25_10185 [Gemmatimonadales bacterium]|jgi:hypothetical protein|nr:hypothetical protein [Gemmatimonadales bacterium]